MVTIDIPMFRIVVKLADAPEAIYFGRINVSESLLKLFFEN